MPMGQNLLTQNFLQHDPLDYHLKSFHRSSLNVLHQYHHFHHVIVILSIGVAPDSDY